ncbi:uncharacterized protein LOC131328439 [Rhododendron vialii]|uniref:uncharacterized protein LOC131328439 n=1 Tax=Rhododendron vialii TaxID=182163 RepID=UPI00265E7477|nr:uncharacterized protein LOC131328439 [Rhododendron vialii]
MYAAHENNAKVECAIYYLSKKMMDYETRYTPLEKTYWGLVWATKKLRHYLLAHPVVLVSQFDLKYVTRKSVKGRAVAEFLADHPVTEAEAEDFMFSNKDILFLLDDTWQLYFNGAFNQCGYGIVVLLVSLNDSHIPLSYKLRFKVTNNQVEYKACIAGMEAAEELGAKGVEIIGDSNLVVSQARGDWKQHWPLWPLTIEQKVKPACECTFTEEGEDDGKPWYEDVNKFLENGEYSSKATSKDKMALRKFAARFVVRGGALY